MEYMTVCWNCSRPICGGRIKFLRFLSRFDSLWRSVLPPSIELAPYNNRKRKGRIEMEMDAALADTLGEMRSVTCNSPVSAIFSFNTLNDGTWQMISTKTMTHSMWIPSRNFSNIFRTEHKTSVHSIHYAGVALSVFETYTAHSQITTVTHEQMSEIHLRRIVGVLHIEISFIYCDITYLAFKN